MNDASIMDTAKLLNSLMSEEGKRNKPYPDTQGKLTIGYGRNLTDIGISDDEAFYLLRNDLNRAMVAAAGESWWPAVADNDARSRAMVDMVFNMGIGGVRSFVNAISLLEQGKFADAANAFRDSKWAQQVGKRAVILTQMIEMGQDV